MPTHTLPVRSSQNNSLYLGRKGSAEFVGVSVRTIDDGIRSGELTAFLVGRRVLIPRDALISWVERKRRPLRSADPQSPNNASM